MINYSKLDTENLVVDITVLDESFSNESDGLLFLKDITGHQHWLLYTKDNRKNEGAIGTFYDTDRDAFIMTQPYPSWVLNETTCLWEALVSRPDTDNPYNWNETEQSWEVIENE